MFLISTSQLANHNHDSVLLIKSIDANDNLAIAPRMSVETWGDLGRKSVVSNQYSLLYSLSIQRKLKKEMLDEMGIFPMMDFKDPYLKR